MNDLEVIEAIQKAIPGATVMLKSMDCSRKGYYIEVQSQSFQGQTLLNQHRMVKKAIASFVDDEILHAVMLKTTC